MMPFGPVGGSSLASFAQLTTTEQGSAPFDPGALAGPGTEFTGGVFRFVIPATATRVDGYRENQICWTARILDVHPSFDPASDILQMAYVHDVAPPIVASNEQFGLSFGILDTDTAGKAACNGLVPCVYASNVQWFSAGAINTGIAGAVAAGAASPIALDVATFQRTGVFAASPFRQMIMDHYTRTLAGTLQAAGRLDSVVGMGPTVANWRMVVGHVKNTTTATAGASFEGRLFTRVVRTAGLSGLP